VVVHDFVMENGEVEGETESNWVTGVQALWSGGGKLVVVECTIFYDIELSTLCALCHVSIIISNHFVKECLGFISVCYLHARAFHSINDWNALIVKFLFDLLFVISKTIVELGVFWVLFNCRNSSNGSSLWTNLVLKSNR